MNSDKLLIIVPIIIYLALMLYIAYRVNGIKNSSFDFAKEYFIGGRAMRRLCSQWQSLLHILGQVLS